MLDPAPDGHMVHGQTPLRHDLLQATIGERVSQVPANAQKNDHVFEMAPAEECWPFSGHDTPYQISAIRVLQHNLFSPLASAPQTRRNTQSQYS